MVKVCAGIPAAAAKPCAAAIPMSNVCKAVPANENKKKKKKKKMLSVRCGAHGCRKKLSKVQQVAGRCRCGIMVCSMHKMDHECTFDHKSDCGKAVESAAFAKLEDKL